MKKNIFGMLLLSGIVLSTAATTVNAADSTEKTDVEVKLTKPKGYENGNGPFKDKLAIVHKPKSFLFESDTTDGALNLDNKSTDKDSQYITVNDDRTLASDSNKWAKGTWSLTGQLSLLQSSNDQLAAKLNFTPGTLYNYAIGDLETKPNGQEDYAPAAVSTSSTADTTTYKLNPTFTLEAGGEEVTFLKDAKANAVDKSDSAAANRGVSTNLGNATLAIATGDASLEGDYKGVITWTLNAN